MGNYKEGSLWRRKGNESLWELVMFGKTLLEFSPNKYAVLSCLNEREFQRTATVFAEEFPGSEWTICSEKDINEWEAEKIMKKMGYSDGEI